MASCVQTDGSDGSPLPRQHRASAATVAFERKVQEPQVLHPWMAQMFFVVGKIWTSEWWHLKTLNWPNVLGAPVGSTNSRASSVDFWLGVLMGKKLDKHHHVRWRYISPTHVTLETTMSFQSDKSRYSSCHNHESGGSRLPPRASFLYRAIFHFHDLGGRVIFPIPPPVRSWRRANSRRADLCSDAPSIPTKPPQNRKKGRIIVEICLLTLKKKNTKS